MLILTPKLGESIQIGDNIKIAILDDITNQVKVGVDAPEDIKVLREEIYEKIQASDEPL